MHLQIRSSVGKLSCIEWEEILVGHWFIKKTTNCWKNKTDVVCAVDSNSNLGAIHLDFFGPQFPHQRNGYHSSPIVPWDNWVCVSSLFLLPPGLHAFSFTFCLSFMVLIISLVYSINVYWHILFQTQTSFGGCKDKSDIFSLPFRRGKRSTINQGQARLLGSIASHCHDNVGTHSPARKKQSYFFPTDPSGGKGFACYVGGWPTSALF